MDISMVGKGKGSKGGSSSIGPCHNCGKTGHLKKDCYSAPKGKGGKDAKGGAGAGKGGDWMANVQCWKCFGYGHMGRDCPKGKGGKDPKGGKGKGKGKKGKKGKGSFSSLDDWADESWTDEGWQQQE